MTNASKMFLELLQLSQQAKQRSANLAEGDLLGQILDKQTLRRLLSALHFRHEGTLRHSRRVALMAVGMAQYLGWEGAPLKILEVTALLHDLGKIGIPDHILFKPGRLSSEEIDLMALHQKIAFNLLQACGSNIEVIEIAGRQHDLSRQNKHEAHAIGGNVPQGGRLLSVADAYDSLSNDQVYRAGLPHDEIMKILHDSAGTKFDGNIVDALARWFASEGAPLANRSAEAVNIPLPPGPSEPAEIQDATTFAQLCSHLYLMENLYDGFYLMDHNQDVVVWSQGMERLLDLPVSEILQKKWSCELFSYTNRQGDLLELSECPLAVACKSGRPAITETHIQNTSGDWIQVEIQSVPLFDQSGELVGAVEIFRNLSHKVTETTEVQQLKLAASLDPLTSVANRGELETRCDELLFEFNAQKVPQPLSVIFLDIDHFKNFNDTYGHAVGDEALISVSRVLQQEMYSGETIGRYGGEEFVILCPDTDLNLVQKKAERIRQAMTQITFADYPQLNLTASFGMSQVEPGDTIKDVFSRADSALYQAKDQGRNRICVFTDTNTQESESSERLDDLTPEDPFVFVTKFQACFAADMMFYKLGGFIHDLKAKLIEISPERALMRVGKRGLFSGWGDTDARRPVEIEMEFEQDTQESFQRGKAASKQVEVLVTIRPLGRVKDAEVFQQRAQALLRELKQFFIVG